MDTPTELLIAAVAAALLGGGPDDVKAQYYLSVCAQELI